MELSEDTIKEIESGKYREYYLIYNRRSTDEPDNQKNSLKYQRSENTRYVFREKSLRIAPVSIKGLCVDGIISERHSGYKEDKSFTFTKDGLMQFRVERPKFLRMADFLNRKLFKGAIFLCYDRASRNKGDAMIIDRLIKNKVDLRFVSTKYDASSAGSTHRDLDAFIAEDSSRKTSERVSLTIRNVRERGICTYRAPVGYLNLGEMENKPFDPIRKPIVLRIGELYATGEWSFSGLARWANKEGLTMPPMKRRRTEDEMLAEEEDEDVLNIEAVSRPINSGHIHRILNNKYYRGMVLGNNGEWVKSISHEAIFPPELCQKIDDVLRRKRTSKHYSKKLPLCHRGIFTCTICGRVYTPYLQKGHSYLGAHCTKDCPNTKRNVSASVLEAMVGELINRLTFSSGELADMDGKTQSDINDIENKRRIALEQSERRKKTIREELSYLRENRIPLLKAGVYTPNTYVEEERRLSSDLSFLQQQEQAADASAHEVIVEVIKLSELLKDGYLHYSFAKSEGKERIIRAIFSELTFDGKTLQYQCKDGFKTLQNRFYLIGDPTGNRTRI